MKDFPMVIPDVRHDIYRSLLDALSAVALPDELMELNLDAGLARTFPADRKGVFQLLRKRFSSQQLCQVGICEPNPEGTRGVRFRSALTAPDAVCIGLADADGDVFDIVSEEGCLSGSELPVTACARDVGFRPHEDCLDLFVTFSTRDMALLRALGMAATTAWGLDELRRDRLAEFRRAFGWIDAADEPLCDASLVPPDPSPAPDDPGEEPAQHPRQPKVSNSVDVPGQRQTSDPTTGGGGDQLPPSDMPEPTATSEQSSNWTLPDHWRGEPRNQLDVSAIKLVAWSPFDWQAAEPTGLNAVVSQIRRLHQVLQLDIIQTSIWQPSLENLADLKFAFRNGDLPLIRDAIYRSVGRYSAEVIERKPVPSVGEALKRYFAPTELRDHYVIRQHWSEARAAITRSCIEPMLALLDDANVSPPQRNRCLIMIHRLQELHRLLMPLPTRRPVAYDEAAVIERRRLSSEMLSLLNDMEPVFTADARLQPRRKRRRISR